MVQTNSSCSQAHQGIYDWSPSLQSMLLGAYYYGYPITQFPGGYLAERFGAKWTLGLSQLIPGLLTLITPAVVHWNVHMLIVLRIIMGISAVSGNSMLFLSLFKKRNVIIHTGAPIDRLCKISFM